MSDLTGVIRDHWSVLDSGTKGSGTWLTSALPVETSGLPLLCALGPDGRRHLLVPVPPGRRLQPDTRAAAVHLVPLVLGTSSRPIQYADLTLLRDDLFDVFTGLCSDVVAAIATAPPDALAVVSQVLDGWHELLRSGTQLGIEQLAGIVGELTVLNRLLDLRHDLLSCWTGPLRSPHDFTRNALSIEVKATASSEGRLVRIHGIDQLSPPAGGDLILWWMRFDTSSTGGTTVPELVARTTGRVGRPQELWQLLARCGYYGADAGRYGGIRFDLVEEARHHVGEGFPAVVPGSFRDGLPKGVSDLRYTLDLETAPPPMAEYEVATFLSAMVRS